MLHLHRPLFLLLGIGCLVVAAYYAWMVEYPFRIYGLPLVFGVVLCWSAVERRRGAE